MRNWWMEANIDGRKDTVTGGPRAKDGQMGIDLFQRVEGQSVRVLGVECLPQDDEKTLVTYINVRGNGKTIIEDLGGGCFKVTSSR
jgi:hypothetical protein